uniref:HERC1 n=1 Tax=Hucho hucho TaxID=62062 RepID=A0A4W5KWC4_9TELE
DRGGVSICKCLCAVPPGVGVCRDETEGVLVSVSVSVLFHQVFAWGDNDHGQQGNGTTTVNRKPTLVQGLEGQKITRVACGSSHSVAWTTVDVTTPSVHEPVLFQTARDSLGASYLGVQSDSDSSAVNNKLSGHSNGVRPNRPSLAKILLSLDGNQAKQQALSYVLSALQIMYAR